MEFNMLLANKVAVITGASGGIGRGIATALAEEGADIILADIKVSSLNDFAEHLGQLKRQIIILEMDTTSSESIEN
jgi:NADP-dependent 3-hydroxy acid dehydrogenase YdfG